MDPNALLAIQDQVENYWSFVIAGYGLSVLAIGGYVVHLIRRGRRLSRRIDPDKRRWM